MRICLALPIFYYGKSKSTIPRSHMPAKITWFVMSTKVSLLFNLPVSCSVFMQAWPYIADVKDLHDDGKTNYIYIYIYIVKV